jgi:hypothetical protein
MCHVRLLPEALFFAFVADISPEGIQLRAAHLVIPHQHLFDPLHLRNGLEQPGTDGFFFDAFDAMDCGERISFGQHCETFNDRLLVMPFAVKNRALSFSHDPSAGGALPSLTAFAREAEFTQISGVYASIIGAFLVPAKGVGGCEFIIFDRFAWGAHSAGNYRSTQNRETTKFWEVMNRFKWLVALHFRKTLWDFWFACWEIPDMALSYHLTDSIV